MVVVIVYAWISVVRVWLDKYQVSHKGTLSLKYQATCGEQDGGGGGGGRKTTDEFIVIVTLTGSKFSLELDAWPSWSVNMHAILEQSVYFYFYTVSTGSV